VANLSNNRTFKKEERDTRPQGRLVWRGPGNHVEIGKGGPYNSKEHSSSDWGVRNKLAEFPPATGPRVEGSCWFIVYKIDFLKDSLSPRLENGGVSIRKNGRQEGIIECTNNKGVALTMRSSSKKGKKPGSWKSVFKGGEDCLR